MPDNKNNEGRAPSADDLRSEDDIRVIPPVDVESLSSPQTLSEATALFDTEAQRGSDIEAAWTPTTDEEADAEEPLPEFDARFRDEYEGLLYVGQLTRDFAFAGHRFRIRTMNMDEILEVGLISKEYAGTIADLKAYQTAMVAGCIVQLDGRPLPQPITMDPADTPLRNRFDYILRNWFPVTIDAVYEQFLLLEVQVGQVLDAMRDAAPLV